MNRVCAILEGNRLRAFKIWGEESKAWGRKLNWVPEGREGLLGGGGVSHGVGKIGIR